MKKNQKKDEEEEEKKRRARLRGELKNEENLKNTFTLNDIIHYRSFQQNEEEEDWDPEGITKVCYNELDDAKNCFIVGTKGQYKGFYYLCNFNSDRPLKAIEMPEDQEIVQLSFNQTGEILIMCFTNGEVRLLNINQPDR